MKPFNSQRYRKKEMVQDAFIVLTPPILTFVGILWFFREEWVPSTVASVLMSFLDSFLSLLTTTA